MSADGARMMPITRSATTRSASRHLNSRTGPPPWDLIALYGMLSHILQGCQLETQAVSSPIKSA
ncbi:hypothetical protein GCM10010412_051600 [Nonomuraea recticatena]|uniref:Uncharacterized protein n=1 Tax=Nonomuraea recticatena TaxID=46178 RepID=A0ABN3S9W4_9ACTN